VGLWSLRYRREVWDTLYEVQNGRCAVCRTDPRWWDGATRLRYIDHDHDTGLIRGLLCASCNVHEGQCRHAHLRTGQCDPRAARWCAELAAYRAAPPAGPFAWKYPKKHPKARSVDE
jgi:Recombination endonuclease VII